MTGQGVVRGEAAALDAGPGSLGVAVAIGAGGFHQRRLPPSLPAGAAFFVAFLAEGAFLAVLGSVIAGRLRPQRGQIVSAVRGRPQPWQAGQVMESPLAEQGRGGARTGRWLTAAIRQARSR